jgi:hypothetical protein
MVARVCGVVLMALLPVAAAQAQGQAAPTVRVLRAAAALEGPQGSANAVGTVNPGEIFEVLDERDGWYLVRPPAGSAHTWRTGWVNGASVERIGGPARQAASPSQEQAPAPPGGRNGIIVGLGGGAGLHTDTLPFNFGDVQALAISTDFRIGYAPTDQVLVFYRNVVGWTQSDRYDVVGMSGAGATYLFSPSSPSTFVTGAIGPAVATRVDFVGGAFDDTERGTGLAIGGGWEFARHWSLEGHAIFLRLGRGGNQRLLIGTINWLFY